MKLPYLQGILYSLYSRVGNSNKWLNWTSASTNKAVESKQGEQWEGHRKIEEKG